MAELWAWVGSDYKTIQKFTNWGLPSHKPPTPSTVSTCSMEVQKNKMGTEAKKQSRNNPTNVFIHARWLCFHWPSTAIDFDGRNNYFHNTKLLQQVLVLLEEKWAKLWSLFLVVRNIQPRFPPEKKRRKNDDSSACWLMFFICSWPQMGMIDSYGLRQTHFLGLILGLWMRIPLVN